MKKAVVAAGAVALFGVAYVGASAYIGTRIQSAYEARMAMVEQRMPFLRIVDRQSDKGLFSSTFSGSVRFGCAPSAPAEGTGKPLVIGFKDHVQHGPLPGLAGWGAATIDSQIVLPPEAPEALRNYVAAMKPQDIRTRVGFGGGYKTAVRLPAGEFSSAQGQAKWPELRLTGAGTLDGSDSSFDATLPELSLRAGDKSGNEGASVRLVNLRLHGRNQGDGSVWLRPGTSNIEVERIELQVDAGPKPFTAQLHKLAYTTELTAAQDLLAMKADITADATLQMGAEAKPIQLDKIELRESVSRLHAPTLQKVIDASMAELGDCDAATRPVDDAQRQARAQEMLTMLGQLLPYDPEFSLDKLAMGYEGQRAELSYVVGVKNVQAKDLDRPGAMRRIVDKNLTLRADGRLPVAWLELVAGTRGGADPGAEARALQAKILTDMALGSGYAVREGDFLTTRLTIEQGAMVLNGKPVGPAPGGER